MSRFVVPVLAAGMLLSVASLGGAAAAPTSAAGGLAAPSSSNIVAVGLVCGPGRHLGPLGRCRPNGAPPVFSFHRCPPGMHRGYLGRCRPNR